MRIYQIQLNLRVGFMLEASEVHELQWFMDTAARHMETKIAWESSQGIIVEYVQEVNRTFHNVGRRGYMESTYSITLQACCEVPLDVSESFFKECTVSLSLDDASLGTVERVAKLGSEFLMYLDLEEEEL